MKTKNGVKWWQEAVIYNIYPFSFMDSNNDGIGDLEGITAKLDYLEDLGIDAIWITPIHPSPWADYGYDVANYTDVDSRFGDMRDLSRLIDQAHKQKIKVLMDFVANHTSREHPWFWESRFSRINKKHDWYIWHDPKPDGGPPTDHKTVSGFGESAWEFDTQRCQYYFHQFMKEQPDLNWKNPEVQKEMLEQLAFWLSFGADGYRFDAVHHVSKERYFKNSLASLAPYALSDEEAHVIFREFRQTLDSFNAVGIAEVYAGIKDLMAYYGKNFDEFHMPFNFSLIFLPWNAENVRRAVDETEANLPQGAWPLWSLGNHDVSRLANRYSKDHTRLAAMLLLTLRGTPVLYYGDEIGMHDVFIANDQRKDRAGRDPERTPMQWDDNKNAGFSKAQPWLPIAQDYKEINVAKELADATSFLNLYRALLRLRRNYTALCLGEYKSIDTQTNNCFVYTRFGASNRFIVALNFEGREQPLLAEFKDKNGFLELSTYLDRKGHINLDAFTLRPYEGCVIKVAETTEKRKEAAS